MSRVAIVFTGGTISMQHDSQVGGNRPALDGAAILALAPDVLALAEVEPIDWGLVPASHLHFAQLIEIARLVDAQLARPDIDGAVIVQGTDTIEETAFAYDLLIRSDKPVAVTGAMRTSSSPDFDGARNLSDAVRHTTNSEMAGAGVVVVMGGLTIPAAQAIKAHSTAMDAFQERDPDLPAPPRMRLPTVPTRAVEEVHLVTAVVGMDGTLLNLLLPQRPSGVVVAATGSGNTTVELLEAAQALMANGTIVALTTRCAAGTVAPEYGFPGGGAKWQQAGALISGRDGPKTRVAVALGLAAGLDRDALAELLLV